MNAIVQHACGTGDLLDATRARHEAYARGLGADYVFSHFPFVVGLTSPAWNRPHAIREALKVLAAGDILVWLDPETLIVTEESIFDVLPRQALVACRHARPYVRDRYRPGALWLRASPAADELVARWLKVGPRGVGRGDVHAFNVAVHEMGLEIHAAPVEWTGYRGAYMRAEAPGVPRVIGLRTEGRLPRFDPASLQAAAETPPAEAADLWARAHRRVVHQPAEAPTPKEPLAPAQPLRESKPVTQTPIKIRTYGGGR